MNKNVENADFMQYSIYIASVPQKNKSGAYF